MASITVKITLGDEMRRFSVKVEDLTYGALDQRVRELFRLSGPTGSTKFLYTDEEGDIITMSSEEEMQEALALALSCTPAILRLKITQAGAPASADPDKNRSAEPSKTPADDANKTPEPTAPDLSDLFKSIGGSLPCAFGPGGFTPDNMDTLMKSVAESLPRFADSLPDELKKALPAAELDIAATMANNPHLFANAGASAASVAEMAAKLAQQAGVSYSVLPPHGAKKCGGGYGDPCVHPGVTCDKSGMSPIVGNRFNLVGHNYDLCEAEYRKLPDAEKVKFVLIEPPFGGACTGWRAAPMAAAANAAANMMNGNGVHWNVSCDKSGMSPIVGNRYTLVGHNYDLCEAEFLKLPDAEKAKFEKIAPPAPPFVPPHCRRGWNGGWNKWGKGAGFGGGCGGGGEGPKLAARFVSDVSIFDGTQMAPNTKFTKIWRLKNVGDVPWPPGTKLLFVGGDQMKAEITVLAADKPVMPDEEVDVAVDMIAPPSEGRYLGYWRLTKPHGRRRFGQRVWCHIQVVDPAKFHGVEDPNAAAEQISSATSSAVSVAPVAVVAPPAAPVAPPAPKMKAPEEATPANDKETAAGPSVTEELLLMGFDPKAIELVLQKHRGIYPHTNLLETATRDLVTLSEWDTMLSDLEEMGFADRDLNAQLIVKNNGSVKLTVKDLVADA